MKKFLKVKEVAELCGCCTETIRKFVDSKKINSFRSPTNYRLIPLQEALKLRDILVSKKAGVSMEPSTNVISTIQEASKSFKNLITALEESSKHLRSAARKYEESMQPFRNLTVRLCDVTKQRSL